MRREDQPAGGSSGRLGACVRLSLALTVWLVFSPALPEDAAEGQVGPAPGGLTVGVTKTNDADGNGQFNKFEVVPPGFGGPVQFRVTIRNTSSVPVQIIGLTDESPPGSAAVPRCPGLIGRILQPGEAVVCAFSQQVGPSTGITTLDRFRAKVGRGTTPPTGGGGEPGLPCTNPDPARCTPPCPDPPVTPLPPPLAGCAPASETGEGMDDSGIRFEFQFPIMMNVDVAKTNDADGDTVYSEVETAPAVGVPVSFRIVIRNLSSPPRNLVITSISDEFPGRPAFPVCTHLINAVLTPGASVSCTFVVPNYAPPPGESRIDTVTVSGGSEAPCMPGFPNRCTASDADSSTVVVDPLPPGPAVLVDKLNDAAGDGTFTDFETAPTSGADVTFRVVVTNPSTVPVTITSITDEFPGRSPFAVSCAPDLVSTTLQPNTSASCTFTVTGYAPPPGSDLVDTVRVAVVEDCSGTQPCRTATALDTSTVRTPGAEVPSPTTLPTTPPTTLPTAAPPGTPPPGKPPTGKAPVAKALSMDVSSLPRTGTSASGQATNGALLVLAGGFLCLIGRARARPAR